MNLEEYQAQKRLQMIEIEDLERVFKKYLVQFLDPNRRISVLVVPAEQAVSDDCGLAWNQTTLDELSIRFI